jgi:uncharacterized protein YuzE
VSEPRFSFDMKLGCGYVSFVPAEVTAKVYRTFELGHGIQVDISEDGRLMGVEIMWESE